jgi:hypothetical protein
VQTRANLPRRHGGTEKKGLVLSCARLESVVSVPCRFDSRLFRRFLLFSVPLCLRGRCSVVMGCSVEITTTQKEPASFALELAAGFLHLRAATRTVSAGIHRFLGFRSGLRELEVGYLRHGLSPGSVNRFARRCTYKGILSSSATPAYSGSSHPAALVRAGNWPRDVPCNCTRLRALGDL